MVDQAQVTAKSELGSAPRAVARNSAEFVHDVVTLVELQASLLKIDIRQCLAGLVVPGAVAISGLVILVSCVPILLAAVALLLVETLHWSYAQAFFATLGGGLVIGGVAALSGAWYVRQSFSRLQRSRDEFVQNVSWVKHVLKRLGQPPRTQVQGWEGH